MTEDTRPTSAADCTEPMQPSDDKTLRALLRRWQQAYNCMDRDGVMVSDMQTLRRETHAALAAPTQAAMQPSVTEFNVGRYCLSEDDCIAEGLNFAAYERGIADAAAAFARNTK